MKPENIFIVIVTRIRFKIQISKFHSLNFLRSLFNKQIDTSKFILCGLISPIPFFLFKLRQITNRETILRLRSLVLK